MVEQFEKVKSTVDTGRELENYVADEFRELGYKYARRSNGSGNKGELGDIAGQDVAVVECKNTDRSNVTIKESVWRKLINELPLHSKRIPLYVLGNKEKRRWVCLEASDFFRIMKGYLENERQKG